MPTPIESGFALANAGLSMMTGWSHLADTLTASNRVIERRTGMMRDAASDPFAADWPEFSRMFSEKFSAFSLAGASWDEDSCTLQRLGLAQFSDNLRLAMSGGADMIGYAARSSDRATRSATTAMRAGAKALAPIHKAATANAKRLG